LSRRYDDGDSNNPPPQRPHKRRHERSWRSYSDFQRPRHPEEQQYSDQPPAGYGSYDRSNYSLSREDVFSEYDRRQSYSQPEYYGDYAPLHEHDYVEDYEDDSQYSYEHWQRSKYGGGVTVPGDWSEHAERYRDDDRVSPQARRRRMPPPPQPQPMEWTESYYRPDDYYTYADEYYRERYMPEEDYLKKMYMFMFRKIDYDIKVPVMQIIATVALFFIFILNFTEGFNLQFVVALGRFSPLVAYQHPALAAFLGAIFGIFLYVFPSLDRDFKRVIIIGTIILLIFFFAGPAIWAGLATQSASEVGNMFARSLIEFLKIAAVLVYWAPMFLGVYGIWSRNSFYVGVSAVFLFLTIIVLDIYLFIEGQPINKIRNNWIIYVIFSIILFCYIEMSDSAIIFARLTSTENQKEIDPSYYEHLDRILKKYFVYFVILTIFIIILSWLTLHFSSLFKAMDSQQIGESLEVTSIYGTIISLIILGIIILFIGLFLRHEQSFKTVFRKLGSWFSTGTLPAKTHHTTHSVEHIRTSRPQNPKYAMKMDVDLDREKAY
jgi:hypothetical protein